MASKPKPERVKMRCTKREVGKIGAIANPLKKDQAAWEQAGWETVKEADKAQ